MSKPLTAPQVPTPFEALGSLLSEPCSPNPKAKQEWVIHTEEHEVDFNAEKAQQIYDRYKFPNQRKINYSTVSLYAREMAAGKFRNKTTITFGVSRSNPNDIWIINGHHTLLAIVEYGKTFSIQAEYYWIDDLADAGRLYATFSECPKTNNQKLKATDLPAKFGVNSSLLGKMVQCLHTLEANFPQKQIRNIPFDDWEPCLNRWSSECRTISDIFSKSATGRKMIACSGAMAFIFFTLREKPREARNFWTRIVNNDGLRLGHGDHMIHKWINENPNKMVMSTAEIFASLAQGWNAFYKDKGRERFNVHRGLIKVTVHGTSWTKHETLTTKTKLFKGESEDGPDTDNDD